MTFLGYILTDLFISEKSYISIKKAKPFVNLNILFIDKKIKEISYNLEKKFNRNNNNIINNNIINNINNMSKNNNINNDLFINLDKQINNLKNKISSLKIKNDEQNKNLDNIIKTQFEIYKKIFPKLQNQNKINK